MTGTFRSPWPAILAVLSLGMAGACHDGTSAQGMVEGSGGTIGHGGQPVGVTASGGSSGLDGQPAGGGATGGAAGANALYIDDATIDQATGADLLELMREIGLARGYAVCNCAPSAIPSDALEACAEGESRGQRLFDPAQARCILEQSRAVPGFDTYVQCMAKQTRDNGRGYLPCTNGTFDPAVVPNPTTCPVPPSDDVSDLLPGNRCTAAFTCSDGTATWTGHCDQKLDCPDGADERGCSDFICGDTLVYRDYVCDCSATFTPPICSPTREQRFLCGDGTDVSVASVCDGTADCANGRDEQYCY